MADFIEFEIRPELKGDGVEAQIKNNINKLSGAFKGLDGKMGGAFKGVGKGVAGLLNPIKGAGDAFKNTFSGDKLDGAVQGAGALNNKFMMIAATLGGIAGAVKGLGIASDFSEETGKLEFAFGKTSDSMKKFIDDLDTQFGVGEASMTSFVAKVGMKLKGLGVSEEMLDDFSQSVTKMSMDLAEAFHADPGQMMDALSGALTGQTRALKQFGIVIDEAALKKDLLGKGIDFEGLDDAQKAAIMMNEINKKMSGAGIKGARMGMIGSYETAIESLQERLKDLTAVSFQPLTEALADPIMQFSNLIKDNKGLFVGFGESVASTITNIIGYFNTLQEPLNNLFNAFLKLGSALGFDTSIITDGFQILGDLFDWALLKITDLLNFMAENSGGFSQFFSLIGEVIVSLKPLLSGFFDYLISGFKLAFKVVNSLLEFLMPALEKIGGLIAGFSKGLGAIYSGVSKGIDFITGEGAGGESGTQEISQSSLSLSENFVENKASQSTQNSFQINVGSSDQELAKKIEVSTNRTVEEHNRQKELELGVI